MIIILVLKLKEVGVGPCNKHEQTLFFYFQNGLALKIFNTQEKIS